MKRIMFFALASVIFVLALASCGKAESTATTTTSASIVATTLNSVSTTKAPDSFDHAFSLKGLTYSPYTFSTPSSAAFVGLVTDGTLDLFELGYEGETVKSAVKTFYIFLEGYDETQKLSIKQSMEENFATAQQISCVTITHELIDDYYVMRVVMNDLDNPENLRTVCNEGLLDFVSAVPETLTITAAEDALNKLDFIKR